MAGNEEVENDSRGVLLCGRHIEAICKTEYVTAGLSIHQS